MRSNSHDRNSKHVRRGHPAVRTMRQTYPEGYGKVEDAFRVYCRKLVATEKPESSQGDAAVAARPVSEIKQMPNGHAMVPDEVKGETGKQQAKWIRDFMKLEYGWSVTMSGYLTLTIYRSCKASGECSSALDRVGER